MVNKHNADRAYFRKVEHACSMNRIRLIIFYLEDEAPTFQVWKYKNSQNIHYVRAPHVIGV